MLYFLSRLALEAELRAWRRAKRRPRLWWRDDDACEVTPALMRLLRTAEVADVPLALAVIPDRIGADLPALLNTRANVWVLQHGTNHENAGEGGDRLQFSPTTPAAEVAERITKSAERLKSFDRALPIYVPPWNNFSPNLSAALREMDLAASGARQLRSIGFPRRVDIHLDLMRWGRRPRFRGAATLFRRLAGELRSRRRLKLWMEPVGLLSHHLDHDEAAWRFLEWMFAWPPLRSTCRWLPADKIL